MRRLRILFAPDSFKGSLSSVGVAAALAEGWRRARPGDETELLPLADGGEGTLEAIASGGGWEWQTCRCHDPLGREVTARWLRSADAERGVVELAEASGLSRVRPEERRPLEATTLGTGELLRSALDAGVRHVVLGIGGSATTDGGAGLLAALGARGAALAGLDPRLAELELRVACDVTNPLLGECGAAATYGPQKGASPEDVATLDRRLAGWADDLEAACGRRERETPGAGAAGGTGFALLCIADRLRSFDLVPGVELLMDETGFDERLRRADLLVTGEGRIDAQTAYGKTALGAARHAAAAGLPCIAVGGAVTADGVAALGSVGALAVPAVARPMALEDAMANVRELLADTGERLARLVELGAVVAAGRKQEAVR